MTIKNNRSKCSGIEKVDKRLLQDRFNALEGTTWEG